MGGDIHNTNLQRDSNEVKGCSKRGHPCAARLDGLNRDIPWHNKGIWRNTYHYFTDAILDLARRDSWFWWAYGPPCMRLPPVHSSRYASRHETSIRRR